MTPYIQPACYSVIQARHTGRAQIQPLLFSVFLCLKVIQTRNQGSISSYAGSNEDICLDPNGFYSHPTDCQK
jgi:hypothetical protein